MPSTIRDQPDMRFADRFHMPEGTYLLSHSAGCQPIRTEAYLKEQFLTPWQNTGECWDSWLSVIHHFRCAIGQIIKAKADNICPVSNVSDGFYKFLTSLPFSTEKPTVLMHENAFPSLGFVIQGLKAQGFRLKLIPAAENANDPKIWDIYASEDVCAAMITHVHSNTGVRTTIPRITAPLKEKGIFTIVDIAQSVGVIPIDIENWQASAVSGSCLKWLCGGPGAGFMWVNQQIMEGLKPQSVGWFSHQNPFEFDINNFEYADDATRFWGGTPSIAPYITALAGLKEINSIGIDTIYKHNKRLQVIFAGAAGLNSDRFSLEDTGGTICLRLPAERSETLAQTFRNEDIRFDQRGHTIRLSFHIYNTETEAQKVGQLTRQHCA